ncbi:MAG: hypothetical protein IJV86_02455 [Clostridia bacterium]|nr:hypothetical protein [Clostridia bacterium]
MSWEVWAMTLSTSWFNFGVFKNTIKRFKWGSFLYFVVLFFSVPFILMVSNFDRLVDRYLPFADSSPILLRSDYFLIPLLMAVAVPTVVAALIFNNVHSGKQSIFVHGLPVKRSANYVSGILAGFVLMALPVVLNAGLLLLMSFTAFGQLISSWSVVYWALVNLAILFIMFSVAVFSAFLTGNTAAHIAINVIIHIVPLLVALSIYLISDIFLFGFIQSENFVASEIMNNTPIVWLFGRGMSHYRNDLNMFLHGQMWAYIVGAIVVYVLGFFLYKNRKVEAAGDVAAFKVFKPILKYTVTSAAAVCIFGITTPMDLETWAIFLIAIALTAIVYFACEMLINKSFKVFSFYKGYVAFALCCAIFIGFFAYTGVFGYEKRVPETADIESAAVFLGWHGEKPVSIDPELIEETREIHRQLIKDIPVATDDDADYRNLRISYKLKSGRWLERMYIVSPDVMVDSMDRMYKFEDYKLKATKIENLNIENINGLTLSVNANNFHYSMAIYEDASEFVENIKKDIKVLSYRQIEETHPLLGFSVEVGCTNKDNKTLKIFKEANGYADDDYAYNSFEISINPSFKNAYQFLKEKGYYDKVSNELAKSLCILKKPVSRVGDLYTYKDDVGEMSEFRVSVKDCVQLDLNDARKIVEDMASSTETVLREGKNYLIFNSQINEGELVWMNWKMISFAENELPEYLKAYIAE